MGEEYKETNCCISVITVDSSCNYVISVIMLKTQNIQEAHGPHRSPEKTVHKKMKISQYVFAIS